MKKTAHPAPPVAVTVIVNLSTSSEHARSRLAAAGTGKAAKTDANYRRVTGPDCCGVCAKGVFGGGENVGTCKKVAGPVRWRMICDFYTSKTSATSNSPTDPA